MATPVGQLFYFLTVHFFFFFPSFPFACELSPGRVTCGTEFLTHHPPGMVVMTFDLSVQVELRRWGTGVLMPDFARKRGPGLLRWWDSPLRPTASPMLGGGTVTSEASWQQTAQFMGRPQHLGELD